MTDYNKKDVIYEITESNGKKTKYIGDGKNERALPEEIRPPFMVREQAVWIDKGWQGAASKSYTTEEINEVLKEEIEALRKQVAELEKERDEWKESAINGGNAGYLREKVAELEKDLDTERRLSFRTQVGILEESIETCKVTEQMYKTSKEYAFEDLRKAQARIAELREALERMLLCDVAEVRTIPRSCGALKSVRDALATKDDTQSLEAYRNSVIDECIEYRDCVSGEYLRGLKR